MARAKQVKQMAVTLPRKKRGRKRRGRAEMEVSRLASGYTVMVRRRVECVPLFRLTERELRDLVLHQRACLLAAQEAIGNAMEPGQDMQGNVLAGAVNLPMKTARCLAVAQAHISTGLR
ncbi:MAG: hypothetical protein WC789_14290 [Lentisphaeria bacterium]